MSMRSRSDNLQYILRTLLDERAEYCGWQIPKTMDEQKRMMRALMNMRPPYPVSSSLLRAQDEELQCQLEDKGVVYLSDI